MIRTSILVNNEEKEYIDNQAINLSGLVRKVIDYLMKNQIPLDNLLRDMNEGDKNHTNV
jgi:hypothetical protein